MGRLTFSISVGNKGCQQSITIQCIATVNRRMVRKIFVILEMIFCILKFVHFLSYVKLMFILMQK